MANEIMSCFIATPAPPPTGRWGNSAQVLVRLTAAVALLAVMASCALSSRPGVAEVKKARKELEAIEVRKTYTQGAGIGALLGAAAGAVIGQKGGRATEGALLGGLSGAAGGLFYADQVVKQRRRYLMMERELDERIRAMRSKKVSAVKFNMVLKGQLAAADKDLKAREAMLHEAIGVVASLDRDVERQQDALAAARAAQGEVRRSSSNQMALQQEVRALKARRDALQNLVAAASLPAEGQDQGVGRVSSSAAIGAAASSVSPSSSPEPLLGSGR